MPGSERGRLVELLQETKDEAVAREGSVFADVVGGSVPAELILFGAGNLGRKLLRGLRSLGIEPTAFTDNDPVLWGKPVEGLEVVPPLEASERYGSRATFVVSIWRGEGSDKMRQRVAQLHSLGCERVVSFLPLFWKYPDIFLPHYAVDLPHRVIEQKDRILAAFDLFADEVSRKEFLGEVRWRLLGDFDELGDPVSTEIYFPDDLLRLSPGEVFVDCGAFDGDTIRRFLARQPAFEGSIKAFEPDPTSFKKLRRYAESLPEPLRRRIELFPYAVGSRREVVRFDATGTESASVGAGTAEVQAMPLDELLVGCSPTYIKMDTEGSEVDALKGAARTISRSRPALAICVYHRQNHLWEVPLLLSSFGVRYRLHLRPQLLEGWDLVCYAVPL